MNCRSVTGWTEANTGIGMPSKSVCFSSRNRLNPVIAVMSTSPALMLVVSEAEWVMELRNVGVS